MKIKIKKLHEDAVLPSYAHGAENDSGMDLSALKDAILFRGEPQAIPTGLSIELPSGYEAQIRPRSGLALKGVTVMNSPGTVDPSYRGDLKAILVYLGNGAGYEIKAGDRIAQLVIARYEPVEWDLQEELAESVRGSGGFGSSGSR
jgi:dUTP pyrophosphatase